jgi:hypothetical protein
MFHARKVTLPGEQDAVVDAQSRKNSPTAEKSDLAERNQALAGLANLAVVEQETMHVPILRATAQYCLMASTKTFHFGV